jgi:hypothetical protein
MRSVRPSFESKPSDSRCLKYSSHHTGAVERRAFAFGPRCGVPTMPSARRRSVICAAVSFARARPCGLFGHSPSSTQGRDPSWHVMRPHHFPGRLSRPPRYSTVPRAAFVIVPSNLASLERGEQADVQVHDSWRLLHDPKAACCQGGGNGIGPAGRSRPRWLRPRTDRNALPLDLGVDVSTASDIRLAPLVDRKRAFACESQEMPTPQSRRMSVHPDVGRRLRRRSAANRVRDQVPQLFERDHHDADVRHAASLPLLLPARTTGPTGTVVRRA